LRNQIETGFDHQFKTFLVTTLHMTHMKKTTRNYLMTHMPQIV